MLRNEANVTKYQHVNVSFIYIAQYHKSQFASRSFTICTAYLHRAYQTESDKTH